MKSYSRKLLLTLSAWVALLASHPAFASTVTPQPATWVRHTLNIDFYNLPHHYNCDELQQKFRDVLLALGARQDPIILTSRCEIGSRSPGVRVQFSMPKILENDSKGGVVVQTAATIVRLEPGHPVSLQAGDCELLHQIKDRLLPQTLQRVMSFNLNCSVPYAKAARFNLSVQTSQPVGQDAPVAEEVTLPRKQLD